MSSTIQPIIHLLQLSLSTYSLYLSSISIRNLLHYEETSKKAASWSTTAAEQLRRTRTTQASSTGALLLTCISSGALFFLHGRIAEVGLAAANVAVLVLVRQHVGAFWKGRPKLPLPGVGDYNEAVSKTQEARLNMAYLAVGWVVSGLVALVI